MILYNCTSDLEKGLKAIDVKELTVAELRTLAVSIATDYQNAVLENDIIVVDALLQITSELASRCE